MSGIASRLVVVATSAGVHHAWRRFFNVRYGILIRIHFGDHPPPHFHVRYGGHKARFSIPAGELLDGELPTRAARLVREWVLLHQLEREENWRRCEEKLPLEPVAPLPWMAPAVKAAFALDPTSSASCSRMAKFAMSTLSRCSAGPCSSPFAIQRSSPR